MISPRPTNIHKGSGHHKLYRHIHSGHLAAIEAHPGPIRNALEDMKEVAVWEREHPGNRVSCVSAHRHLADKRYWWFLIVETT